MALPELRLICDTGKQLGVMPPSQALDVAAERGLDLLEVSPAADPPVWKLGTIPTPEAAERKQQQQKQLARQQEKQSRKPAKEKKQKRLKEIRITDRCDARDAQTKAELAKKFLAKGHPVRLAALNTGRLDPTGQKTVAQVLVEDIGAACASVAALGSVTGAVSARREPGANTKNALGVVALMLNPNPKDPSDTE